jgi:hypothetical protein
MSPGTEVPIWSPFSGFVVSSQVLALTALPSALQKSAVEPRWSGLRDELKSSKVPAHDRSGNRRSRCWKVNMLPTRLVVLAPDRGSMSCLRSVDTALGAGFAER